MEKDRNGLDCNVLRFVAQMETTRPIDQDRRFIIFYHLADDTISIFEPPLRNSGKEFEESVCLSLCMSVCLTVNQSVS